MAASSANVQREEQPYVEGAEDVGAPPPGALRQAPSGKRRNAARSTSPAGNALRAAASMGRPSGKSSVATR